MLAIGFCAASWDPLAPLKCYFMIRTQPFTNSSRIRISHVDVNYELAATGEVHLASWHQELPRKHRLRGLQQLRRSSPERRHQLQQLRRSPPDEKTIKMIWKHWKIAKNGSKIREKCRKPFRNMLNSVRDVAPTPRTVHFSKQWKTDQKYQKTVRNRSKNKLKTWKKEFKDKAVWSAGTRSCVAQWTDHGQMRILCCFCTFVA